MVDTAPGQAAPNYYPEETDESLIPSIDYNFPGYTDNTEQWCALFQLLYSTLEKKSVLVSGQTVNYVFCNFLGSGQDVLQRFQDIGINANTIACHPMTLFRFVSVLLNSEVQLTRTTVDQIAPLMQTEAINTLLMQNFTRNDDSRDNMRLLAINCFLRCLKRIKDVIRYQSNRARLLIEAVYHRDRLNISLPDAETAFSELSMSLVTRNVAHQKILDASKSKQNLGKLLNDVKAHYRESLETDLRGIFHPLSNRNTININTVKTTMNAGLMFGARLYWDTYRLPADFEVNALEIMRQFQERLTPLTNGIRSFALSDYDIGIEKRNNLKPIIAETVLKVRTYDEDHNKRSVGGVRQLLRSLTLVKEEITKLRLAGVSVREEDVGISQEYLDESFTSYTNYLTELEEIRRVNEAKEKIVNQEIMKSAPSVALRKLRGASDYLAWSKSVQEILTLHQSPMLRLELLRKSLENREDQLLIKDLDLSAALKVLKSKYNTQDSIPRLLEELLAMKAPANENQSYHNIAKFMSITQQLKSHGSLNRLDAYTRSKLTPLLLTPASLCLLN